MRENKKIRKFSKNKKDKFLEWKNMHTPQHLLNNNNLSYIISLDYLVK